MREKGEEIARIREIYEASFPAEERREYDDLLQVFSTETGVDISLYTEGEDVIGFIIYWNFSGFVYVEHFAVNPAERNKGVGSRIMSEFIGRNALPVVLEVEIPREESSCRRVSFYRRIGFHLYESEYIQPPYNFGKKPVPMRLMSNGKIDFEAVKKTLYERVYKVVNN